MDISHCPPAGSAIFIILRIKALQILRFHKSPLDIQRNIQPAGSGTAGLCQIQGFFQTIPDSHGIDHHFRILCHAVNGLTDIKLLISHCPDSQTGPSGCGIVAHLTGENQHGNGIQPPSQYACNRIGAAGTCGNAQSGNLIVNPCVGLCRYSAGLLMVIIDAAKPFLMAQGIVQMHRSAACYHKCLTDSRLYKHFRNII